MLWLLHHTHTNCKKLYHCNHGA